MNKWVEEHFEGFVKGRLGVIPEVNEKDTYYGPTIQSWTPRHLNALVAIWHQAKKRAEGRQILLAGRDVFLLEVLARLEGFPTLFRSDISGSTCHCVKEDYSACFLIDTGFKGTVPAALKIEHFNLISFNEKSANRPPEDRQKHQVFPGAYKGKWATGPKVPVNIPAGVVINVASMLEAAPKYWTRAERPIVKGAYTDGIMQTFSADDQFTAAARMTRKVVEHVCGPLVKARSRVFYSLDQENLNARRSPALWV